MADRLLARSLMTSLVVGSGVTLGHYLAPGAPWWPIIHFLLPVTVFCLSALAAGHRVITFGLVSRGVATVAIVGMAFTAINTVWTLPPLLRGALNYLVPFVVSMVAGSTGVTGTARRTSTERRS